jgi:hypothetical protein
LVWRFCAKNTRYRLSKQQNFNRETDQQLFLFENAIFRVEPSSGVIWPNSSADINIYFTPEVMGNISAVAYCAVEGRETRLPLQLKVFLK